MYYVLISALIIAIIINKIIIIIFSILGNLSNMAVSMGTEIEKQNSQLDNIQGKVAVIIIIISNINSIIIIYFAM